LVAVARTLAGAARRRLLPTAEEAAWRAIRQRAEREPRRTRGTLRLMDLDIEYVDALSLAPQWHDIFVRRALEFDTVSAAPTILDCGANVGLAAMWLRRAYPQARITAYEADPQVYEVLQRNLNRNGMSGITARHAAIWREASTIPFRCEGSDAGAIDRVGAATAGTLQEVPSVRLRDVLAQSGTVDFMKMDIEGAELDVLEDAADLLPSVRAMQVEVHDFDPARRMLPRCLTILERAGFEYALGDFSSAVWRSESARRGPFAQAVPAWVVLVRAWSTPQ
jgi:FkbM family methyltransferase